MFERVFLQPNASSSTWIDEKVLRKSIVNESSSGLGSPFLFESLHLRMQTGNHAANVCDKFINFN